MREIKFTPEEKLKMSFETQRIWLLKIQEAVSNKTDRIVIQEDCMTARKLCEKALEHLDKFEKEFSPANQ